MIVLPSPGHLQLRCRCGHMDFGVHVKPLGDGAVVKELICRQCSFVLKVQPDMSFERIGKSTDMKGNPLVS